MGGVDHKEKMRERMAQVRVSRGRSRICKDNTKKVQWRW